MKIHKNFMEKYDMWIRPWPRGSFTMRGRLTFLEKVIHNIIQKVMQKVMRKDMDANRAECPKRFNGIMTLLS